MHVSSSPPVSYAQFLMRETPLYRSSATLPAASVYTSCDTLLSALKKVYTHACTHSHRHMYSVQQ